MVKNDKREPMKTSWSGFIKPLWFSHERDDEGDFGRRALMHIPIGLIIGIPLLGYPVLKLFEKYEDNEDLHTHDEAWKDYFGALIGATITSLIAFVGFIWLVLKLLN